ncbi:AAA family ATPase [Flavobacterium sp. ACN6]|uniref:AAA family ATPase n=1 Tax=Flavobacterium sp. ACN6 TaxID=1920426 RepID=UPI000BB31F1D|nr:AAA family ATPase [Flavobacterium sp. ACN6]PBJ14364.1 recombination protein F [Flavobacterium sp. ACN6]
MEIKRIKIQNFKVFKEITVDFSSSDLIIFDGPNGFGKTSLYDAIELLFTGSIRRYNELQKLIVDGRESYEEHPFYNEGASGDIVVCIEFVKDSTSYFLERIAKTNDLSNRVDFSIYHLYEKDNFDSQERILIANEEDFLSNIFGGNYKENFKYLNYIEQEDSLFLLKNQDKNRKQHISHLFNVSEFENKIEVIKILKQKIDKICSESEGLIISELKSEIKQIQEILAKDFEETEFIKLFSEKDIFWDEPDFDYNILSYKDLFDEDGIMTQLDYFIVNKSLFKDYMHNETINSLLRDEILLNDFLRFYAFIEEKDELLKAKKSYNQKLTYLEKLKEFSIDDLEDEFFEYDFDNFSFLDSDLIDDFRDEFEILKKEIEELNSLETIYSNINDSREKLIKNIEKLKEEEGEISGNCLLCGNDWGDIDELLINISIQSDNLEEVTGVKSKKFNERLEEFKNEIVSDIINDITNDLTESKVDVQFIDKLCSFELIKFNNLILNFSKIDFNYVSYLSQIKKMDHEIELEKLILALKDNRRDFEIEKIQNYFREYFNEYFDNNYEALEKVDLDMLKKKTRYLKYNYSILQSDILIEKNKELEIKETKFKNAEKLSKQLKGMKDVYDKSLKKYQKKVIKDIEIIFHIYSGRIMQDFQGGLGLFIYSDKNGIRFQTNPAKTFDAVFSMSSGQLSALIIAFTLALHKKYSKNKIVLIDDPVQTMDELNVVGFVELLRNEFNKNQIIISTHEEMMSSFIRYKFKNYNLTQKRVNLKSMN